MSAQDTRKSLVSSFLPSWMLSSSKFYLILPFVLFLTTLALMAQIQSPLLPILPLLMLVGWGGIALFRLKGLWASFALLAAVGYLFPSSLWQLSALYVVALELFITLLAWDEVGSLAEQQEQELHAVSARLSQKELDWSRERASLLDEVQAHLEAHRSLEKEHAVLLEHFSLAKNEVSILTKQKGALFAEKQAARSEAFALLSELTPAELGNEGLKELERKLAEVSGKHKQLRQQFDEKTSVLDETRKELFVERTALLEAKKKIELLGQERSDECHKLEKALAQMGEELATSEEEVARLEALFTDQISS